MKTLYVTDLDGTLLEEDQTIRPQTIQMMNQMIDDGIMITYASARSLTTAKKVTSSIHFQCPVICQNGTFIIDRNGNKIYECYLEKHVVEKLNEYDVHPIVYAEKNNRTYFSYIENPAISSFLKNHADDPRKNPVHDFSELLQGDIYYILVIDEYEKLMKINEALKNQYHIILDQDHYSQEWWLEIMSLEASKGQAIEKLKEELQCDRVVVFGDGKNDKDMFQQADYCCAMENADDSLKQISNEVLHESVAQYIWKKEYSIIPAQKKDLEKVYDFICLLEGKKINKNYFIKAYQRGLDDKDTFYFLHEHGFISMHRTYYLHHDYPTGEVVELIVDSKYRSQKIGEKLLLFIESLGKELGLEEICLCTSTYRKQAHAFYEKHGYIMNHYNYIKKL